MTPSAEDRHILVVGGAGYIGSVLIRVLLSRGFRVRVLDNLIYDNGASMEDLHDNPGFSFIKGDFCDGETVKEALKDVTDVVLLAALVGDPICRKYPREAVRVNDAGTIEFFDRANGQGLESFVFLSTCSTYGLRSDDDYATELSELNPQSLYAETKVKAEKYLIDHKDDFDYCPTMLRLATAYGISRRMRFDLTISDFTRQLTLGKELLVYDEETWRPYCHIGDTSDAIMRVLLAPRDQVCGQIFNVGSREDNYTKKMVVEMILGELGHGKVKYQAGGSDPRNYRVSFDKIVSVLDFTNKYSVLGSIRRVINFVKSGMFDDVDQNLRFYTNTSIKGLKN